MSTVQWTVVCEPTEPAGETEPTGARSRLPLHRKIPQAWPEGFSVQEQVMGIEPTYSAWKADVLPLNHTCILN